jgi:hypothetical protein
VDFVSKRRPEAFVERRAKTVWPRVGVHIHGAQSMRDFIEGERLRQVHVGESCCRIKFRKSEPPFSPQAGAKKFRVKVVQKESFCIVVMEELTVMFKAVDEILAPTT